MSKPKLYSNDSRVRVASLLRLKRNANGNSRGLFVLQGMDGETIGVFDVDAQMTTIRSVTGAFARSGLFVNDGIEIEATPSSVKHIRKTSEEQGLLVDFIIVEGEA